MIGESMADISIQFHAALKELISFTSECVREFGLHVTAIRFHPFETVVVEPARLGEIIADSSIRRLALTLSLPVIGAKTLNRFLDQNPNAMLLDLGRLSDAGLKESWLTARTSEADALRAWKQIAGKLKETTRAGAVAVNPQTGASSKLKTHRCTAGARALQGQGVKMLPAAGTSVIVYAD